MRVAVLAFLAFTLAGSLVPAQEQTQPAPSQVSSKQQAVVYVYRYKQFVGAALSPSVYCDDAQLARMENGRYFTVKIDPGQHTFRANDPQSGVQLDVKAGQQYFLRMEIATGFMKGHGRLVLMAAEQARYELQSDKLKPLDASKVVDTARVSVEVVKLDTPAVAGAPPASPTPMVKPVAMQTSHSAQASDEQVVHGETLSDGAPAVQDQMSLGDAARKARQKKTATDSATQPQ